MTSIQVACIVEGQGDEQAVRVLLPRMALELSGQHTVQVVTVIRTYKSKLVKPGELERQVVLAGNKLGGHGGIIILIDADKDCPAQLGPELLQRARTVRGDLPIAIVLAKPEFESWLLAGADSLRGVRGLGADLTAPHDPEVIRNAKGWLAYHMPVGRKYRETIDQAALAAQVDLVQACRAPSFRRFCGKLVEMIAALA